MGRQWRATRTAHEHETPAEGSDGSSGRGNYWRVVTLQYRSDTSNRGIEALESTEMEEKINFSTFNST